MKRKWSPITRGIRYDPAKVAAAYRRRADDLEARGRMEDAEFMRYQARSVEGGFENIREAARDILAPIEFGWDEDEDEGSVKFL